MSSSGRKGLGEEQEEEKRIFGAGSPSRSGSPRNSVCDNCPCARGRGLLAGMFIIHVGIDLQDVTLACGPHPEQPFCRGSKRDPGPLTRLLTQRQPRALTWHLCLEKGNFIWEIREKAPSGPSKSVGAMRLIVRRIEGDNLALGRPASAPRPPPVSAHAAAGSVFRWRLGTR